MTHSDEAGRPCDPLMFDFERFAAMVEEHAAAKSMPIEASKAVWHTVYHLREEVPDLDNRQIARVLFAVSFLMTRLLESSPKWNGIAVVNILTGSALKMWRAGQDNLNTLLVSQGNVAAAVEQAKLDRQRAAAAEADRDGA